MRILSIHNLYQTRGGEDESRQLEEALLRRKGHQVEIYEENNRTIPEMTTVDLAFRTVWSRKSYNIVRNKLRKHQSDLVHVQNFFPLISPSVYYAAKSQRVPVVQTLRNFRLLCLNGFLFRNGQVCEVCLQKKFPWPGVKYRCYRDSFQASLGVFGMLTAHRILGTWDHLVDQYIALTHYDRDKFIEGGIPGDRISVKPNFVDPDPEVGDGTGKYILFVGRLSTEKGIDTFIDAARQLGPDISFIIVGDGPLAPFVHDATQRWPHIQWLGRKTLPEVYEIMGKALLLVFPSKWNETFSRVVVESFAKGTPVIASGVSNISDLVSPYRTGLMFCPGDSSDLATQIRWALAHPHRIAQMRKLARIAYERNYTAEKNYLMTMDIYQLALDSAKSNESTL